MRTNTKNIKKFLACLLIIMTAVSFTPTFALNAFADSDLTLVLADESKTEYKEGDPITVIASGSVQDAWVGLYKKEDTIADPLNGGSGSVRWFWVREHNGEEVDITSSSFIDTRPGNVTPGEYQIILFGDGLYDNQVKTINITVTEDEDKEKPEPADELSLSLIDPPADNTYKVGEPVTIKATGIAPGAWIGLYQIDEVYDPDNGGVVSLRWYYIADHNGEKVDILSGQFDQNHRGAIGEGEYKIVLFGDGLYGNVLDTINIKVEGMIDIDEDQFSLETDKTEYAYGENIKVKAKGKGISDGAWVGMYPADSTTYGSNYYYYYYVRDAEDVFTIIQNKTKGSSADKTLGDGWYKLIIFASDGYVLPVESKAVKIKITRATISQKTIREPGCVTYGLEYVTYEDGTSEYREIPTLGGHDWNAPVHVDGTATHKYTCKRNDNHQKTEACSKTQEKLLKAATAKAAGEKEYFCDVCNSTYTVAIPKLKEEPVLSADKYVYNGKTKKPKVSEIVDENGDAISEDFYTITYPSKSIAVGSYTVAVKFSGDYSGTYNLKYVINPKATSLTTVTKGKKSFKAKWKKVSKQATGYQIAYSTSKSFKGVKYKKVKKYKTTSLTVKKLKAKKKYYVKIRTYKTVKGNTYYSAWSKVKTVKTK